MRPEYSASAWEQKGFTEDSARLWAELGLSPEEALSFYEAGFSVEEARPWVEAGFKNGERCKRWQGAGFRPEEVRVYESFGLNIEHAKRLKAWKITALRLSPYLGQTKLTDSLNKILSDLDSLEANPQSPPKWVRELLNDLELSFVLSDELKQKYQYSHEPTDWDMLKALGGELASAMVEQLDPDLLIEAAQQEVSAAELLKAQVYGVPLKDYLKYRPHGLSLEEARELIQAGVKPEDFPKDAEQGLTYAEILNIARRGVNLSEYLYFRKYGLTSEQAKDLLQAGVKPEDYVKGVEQGLTYSDILNIARRGVNLSEYLRFRRCGVTPEQAEELLRAGVKPEDYVEGVKQGLAYSDILNTAQRGVNLSEYLRFRRCGVTPEQAEELLRAGVEPEDYVEGVKQGFAYSEILDIAQRGVNLSEYLRFRRCGVTPEQAEELLRAGVKPEDYVEGVKQGFAYSEILDIAQRGVNLSEYLHLRKYGITLRESTFVAQGLQQIAIEGPLSVSSPLLIEKSSLTLKNLSLRTLRVSDSQVILEGCSFPRWEDLPSPRLEIVSSEVALEGVHIKGGEVGIHVRDSRLTLREVSLTGLGVGIRVEGQTKVKGDGRLEIFSSEVALEGVTIKGGEAGIHVRDSRLTLREVSLTWLHRVGMLIEGKTAVEGEQLSISTCRCGMEIHPGARVQLTRPTLSENGTGIAVAEAALLLKGPGELTHHRGPAILVEKDGTLSAEELTFERNQKDSSTDSSTGQIHLVGAAEVSLQKITVQNSLAIGLYAEDCPDIRMTNSTFTSNLYGAIRLVRSRLIASEVKILENGGAVGGRFYWQVALYDQAHLKIEKSSIEHGKVGGINAERSEVEVVDCIVADHQFNGLGVGESSTARVVGGTFRANQVQILNLNSTVEVRDAVLDGDGKSQKGLWMLLGHVVIKKCQIHSHNEDGVRIEGGSGCIIEDSQLENNGLASSKDSTYAQLLVQGVEKVALSDLRVIGGKGGGVVLLLCKNASLSGKSTIRGNQGTGLRASWTQITMEQVEFQDNGKASTPDSYYYYQILADEASNVHLKEVQIYEGQHSGGVWVRKQSTVTLRGGSIHRHGKGAIVVQDSGSKIVVIGARIFENAQEGGAQVIVRDSGAAEMEDTLIQDSLHGGVLVEDGGTLILKRCQVHNNKAYNLKREGTGRVEFIDMPPVED